MMKTKYAAWITLYIIVSASPHGIEAADACMDVSLRSDKLEYLTYEPILIYYSVTNSSAKTIASVFDAYGGCLIIHDQNDRRYGNTMESYYTYMPDTLNPGESFEGSEKIGSRYLVNQPGTYTCFMEIPKVFVSPECPYMIKSESISFAVDEPDGKEAKAFELYLRGYNLYWNKEKNQDSWMIACRTFMELAEVYPNSVYAVPGLRYALLGHRTQNHMDVAATGRVFIEKNDGIPEPLLEVAFEGIVANYRTIENKLAAIDCLNYLIKKYPGTRISEKAEYWLRKVQEWEF